MLHTPHPVSLHGFRRNLRRRLFTVSVLISSWLIALVGPAASAQTAMQLYVEAMQPGWNLGNSLDAIGGESGWGNPPVTRELIQHIADLGFKSIRLPVSWDTSNRTGPAPNYTLNPAFLDRLEQVVTWSLDAGLYVMINLHHDTNWLRTLPDGYHDRYVALWTQIATRFRDYPRELHFESLNEPAIDLPTVSQRLAVLRDLNVTFFDIVRGTGGGNAIRPLVLPTYETNSSQVYLDSLKSTMDELDDPNLIATIHFYGYWSFAVNIAGTTTVTNEVIANINDTFNGVYDTFIANGIPVIVGEFGLLAGDPGFGAIQRGEMLKFFEIATHAMRTKGAAWQWWDNGNYLNRQTLEWRDPERLDYLMRGVVGRSSTAKTNLVFVKSAAPADVAIQLNLNGNTFVSITDNGTPLTAGVDYTLAGDVLTLKAGFLAGYSSGEYGEKAVLDANFNAGMPWKLYVRHLGPAFLDPASTTEGRDLVIPADFGGDLMATMEARYVGKGSPYPGQAAWTPFKQFDEAYRPNYSNDTIAIKNAFFDESTTAPIDLTFHMWSGRTLTYRLNHAPGSDLVPNPQEFAIYADGPAAGWSDAGSWTPRDLGHTTVVHSGTVAIEVTPVAWGVLGLSLSGPQLDTSAYQTLTFWIHGGSAGGQTIGVFLQGDDSISGPWVRITAPAANTWSKVEIPLAELGFAGRPDIRRVFFQNGTGSAAPVFYLDDIGFTTAYASDRVFIQGVPPPAARLELQGLALTANGRIQFTVTGTAGLPYAVERSTDLTTWQTVANGTVTTPAGTFTETQTQANAERRFYRARQTGNAP